MWFRTSSRWIVIGLDSSKKIWEVKMFLLHWWWKCPGFGILDSHEPKLGMLFCYYLHLFADLNIFEQGVWLKWEGLPSRPSSNLAKDPKVVRNKLYVFDRRYTLGPHCMGHTAIFSGNLCKPHLDSCLVFFGHAKLLISLDQIQTHDWVGEKPNRFNPSMFGGNQELKMEVWAFDGVTTTKIVQHIFQRETLETVWNSHCFLEQPDKFTNIIFSKGKRQPHYL